jgi:hypothetical protein
MSYIGNQPVYQAFVTDQFSGNGSTTAFTMSVAPATTTSVLIAITGVVQDPSTYSVSGTTLTFSAAPPTGTSNISVRYMGIPASGVTTTAYRTVTDFTATAGQTTFSVPSYTVGYIDVYRNGVRLAAADYTATDGTTVVLVNAATVGDSVVTESFYVSSVLNAIPATAGAVNTTYLADSSVTTEKIAAGAVTQLDLATGVAGTGPAFSVYRASSGQSATAGVWTKVQFQTEEFDTNSNYDNVTNFRFQPTVAGYYSFAWMVYLTTASAANMYCSLYKNGVIFKYGTALPSVAGYNTNIIGGNALLYMNGSTDYAEVYINTTQAATINIGADLTYFQGFLARAA